MKRTLHPVDRVFLGYAATLSVIGVVGRVSPWFHAFHAVAAAAIALLAYAHARYGTTFWRVLHDWYALLFIPAAFREMNYLTWALDRPRVDEALASIDAAWFGDVKAFCDAIAHPLVADVLSIGYWSYFLLPIAVGAALYRSDVKRFRALIAILVSAWFLSYLGYLAVPAVGPHWSESPRHPALEGYGIAGALHQALLAVEMDITDAFPSGHAMIAGMLLIAAWRWTRRTFWVILPFAVTLILATVYLRYHYVVDIVAAVPTGMAGWLIGARLARREWPGAGVLGPDGVRPKHPGTPALD